MVLTGKSRQVCEENVCQCHSGHNKSHMDWSGKNTGLGDQSPEVWHSPDSRGEEEEKVKVLLSAVLPSFRKRVPVWKIHRLRPLVFLVRAICSWRWVWSIGGMILTGETEVLAEKRYTAWVVDEWMSMEHWWNDTDRGNWSTGRKTLYSVGGRWMNEYGALVEWYWQWKLKYWEKNIIQRGW